MSTTKQQAELMDKIEVEVHEGEQETEADKRTGLQSASSIEVQDVEEDSDADKTTEPESKDADEVDQIVFMLRNLTTVQKRRTMHLLKPELEPLFSSTLIGESVELSDKTNETSATTRLKSKSSVIAEKDQTILRTSSSDITLRAGTSNIHITTSSGKGNYVCKLRNIFWNNTST